ncbi:MAG: efflux RND transporter periplasmic adaptor subunit [Alphaproteobacteria bacterium]|nr:efflux RND transporter periplasmic adaptor subunit [Alphaproteobacteria bacterium]
MNAGARLWRWRYQLLAVAVAGGAAWYLGASMLLGPIVNADVVVRAEFVQSVVASGHVQAPFRVNIGSKIIGVVTAIPVDEGQTVRTGDTLVVLDDYEARAAVVQAEGAVAQAEARLRQMRELVLPSAEEALRQAKATLVNAQQTYDRTAKLAANDYATKAALDDATKTLDIARAQVRNAEFQVYTNRPGGSDYVMAETQQRQAEAALATARSRLGYTVIKAPRDGILIARNVERGNVVQPADVLMKLSPTGDTELVVQIDEKNLGLIAIGQKALASADAYPKDSFAAEVVYINPGVDLQRASVEVKLRVPDAPAYLSQDMTISADIEVARHPEALVAPASSLRGVAAGRPWVMKVAAGRAVRQPVKVGRVGIGKAEILEGVAPGDVVLPATATVKEGARIRAQVAPAT